MINIAVGTVSLDSNSILNDSHSSVWGLTRCVEAYSLFHAVEAPTCRRSFQLRILAVLSGATECCSVVQSVPVENVSYYLGTCTQVLNLGSYNSFTGSLFDLL
eukprot:SAG11_NODE_10316_length_840_cov_1.198381_2_plen_103_part_00